MLAQHSLRNAGREFPASLSQNTKIIQLSLHKWPYSPRTISSPSKLIPLSPCGRQSFVPVSLSRTGRAVAATRAVGAAQRRGTDGHSAATRRTRTMRRGDSLFVRDRRGRDGAKGGTEKAKSSGARSCIRRGASAFFE